jgi:hypothetical protein
MLYVFSWVIPRRLNSDAGESQRRKHTTYESVLWIDTVEWLSYTLFPQYALVGLLSIEKFAVKKVLCYSSARVTMTSRHIASGQVRPLARYCNLYFKQLWSVTVSLKGIYCELLLDQIVWL